MSPRSIIIHYEAGVIDKLKPGVLSYWVKRDLGNLSVKSASEQELQVRKDEATPNIVQVDLDIDEDSGSRKELNLLIDANSADEIFRLSQHKICRIAEGSQPTTLTVPDIFEDLDLASNASDFNSDILSLPRGIKRKSEDPDGEPDRSRRLVRRQNITSDGSAQDCHTLSASDTNSSERLRRDLKEAEGRAVLAEAAQKVLEQRVVSAREDAAAEAEAHKRTCHEAKRILDLILAKVKRLEEGRLRIEGQQQTCITNLQGELRRERTSRKEIESTSNGRISELETRLQEESLLRKQAEIKADKTASSLCERGKRAEELEDTLTRQKEELSETRNQHVKSQSEAAQKRLDLERKLQLEEDTNILLESKLQDAMGTVERLMTERFTVASPMPATKAASPMPAPIELTYESVGLQTEELPDGVLSDLAKERQGRLAAERQLLDIRKECHEPFVVPNLLDIFLKLSGY